MIRGTMNSNLELSMSRLRKRWTIGLILIGASTLTILVVLHDATASPADALTSRALKALGLPLTATQTPRLVVRDGGLGPVSTSHAGETFIASFDAGETTMNQVKKTTVTLENAGTAPLTLQLDHVSCACFQSIKINGYIMGLRDRSATLLPGEAGVVEVALKADPEEIRVEELPKDGRFGLTFLINTPGASRLRVEMTSRLVASDEP